VRYAAIAENHSNHPIAKSIVTYYERDKEEITGAADKITEIAGHGIAAEYAGVTIYAGNEKLMQKYNISFSAVKEAGSIVHVAADNRYLGYILISDEVKQGTREAISALKQMGVRHIVMLTGDRKNAAQEIADQCQVDEFQAELLPQDKVAWFEKYKNDAVVKGKIVFVGDGINDAPVLAGADIGIAMGGIGSDAAIEAADVVIMNDEPGKIVTAIKIARKTKQIVMQNIIFALGIKLLIMILSFLGISSIWFAIFADVGVALLALFNAMRAMYIR
jgi:Cd2+/Zn2+-exporting ATPase